MSHLVTDEAGRVHDSYCILVRNHPGDCSPEQCEAMTRRHNSDYRCVKAKAHLPYPQIHQDNAGNTWMGTGDPLLAHPYVLLVCGDHGPFSVPLSVETCPKCDQIKKLPRQWRPMTDQEKTEQDRQNETVTYEAVHSPKHYGGAENPHEHFKCMLGSGVWRNGFLYNATKYIWRFALKPGADPVQDLEKAAWYLNQAIEQAKRDRSKKD